MNIPRFWARANADVRGRDGRPLALAAWGWSSTNRSEAEASARDRLGRLVARVEQGLELPRGYAYGERALREEIIEEVRGRGGDLVGVVTRNSYGSAPSSTLGPTPRMRPFSQIGAKITRSCRIFWIWCDTVRGAPHGIATSPLVHVATARR